MTNMTKICELKLVAESTEVKQKEYAGSLSRRDKTTHRPIDSIADGSSHCNEFASQSTQSSESAYLEPIDIIYDSAEEAAYSEPIYLTEAEHFETVGIGNNSTEAAQHHIDGEATDEHYEDLDVVVDGDSANPSYGGQKQVASDDSANPVHDNNDDPVRLVFLIKVCYIQRFDIAYRTECELRYRLETNKCWVIIAGKLKKLKLVYSYYFSPLQNYIPIPEITATWRHK
jgi:hypothetical protein